MQTINCEICKEVSHVAGHDWRYVDRHGPFACSPECLVEWITRQPSTTLMAMEDLKGTTDGRVIKNFSSHSVDEARKCMHMRDARGDYERAVSEVLLYHDMQFFYESFTFAWGTKVYTPDFIIVGKFCIVEVKGDWKPSQKSKYQSFRAEFPEIPMLVIPWIIHPKFFMSNKRKRVGFGVIR